ncbi:MAG TPA: hypothetical protein VKA84_18715 [Gemmatimonadaceae bacterium]|nr:hypothetical protein [Gemmatimonadaceae bacterium]
MGGLRLVHEVLDSQLVDRRKEKIGRVDALVLELRDGEPPCVAAILVGGAVRAERVGRWMVWLNRALRSLARARGDGVSRISFDAVRRIADTIEVDVDGESLPSGRLERWLAEKVVCRIPGARGEGKGHEQGQQQGEHVGDG